MKKPVIAFVVLCGAIAGAIVYLNKQKSPPPAPAPVAESTPGQSAQPVPPEKIVAPKPESPPTISANAGEPAKISAATPVVTEAKPDDSANPIHKAVDALLSAKSAGEKHDLFQQLLKSGQLDAVIEELKQRAMDNPNNPQLPTTLGEAELNKVSALYAAGGDRNEMGILAMQADQSFNAALKIDPQNWEAQFVKSSSMFYWPANPEMDNQVVQNLSKLVDQQETMPAQPEFAQTYVVLGNEYQKIGQPDKAIATWQLGLTKFPNDPTLLKKINGQ
jgi:tetratricopeptide (TPR) repeat protein